MVTITSLRMWKDPGYTKGCTEVPPVGSDLLPTPDYELTAGETLRPRKNTILEALELPLSYSQVFDMSYLNATFQDGSGSFSVYGWITRIEQIANAAEAVRIYWTVDYWRTFSRFITWGDGYVKRAGPGNIPSDVSLWDNRRPGDYQPVHYSVDTETYQLIQDVVNGVTWPYWIIMRYVEMTSGNVSKTRLLTWPAGRPWNYFNSGESQHSGPTLEMCYSGTLDESLGLTPSQIGGIWVSPIAPVNCIMDEHGIMVIMDTVADTKINGQWGAAVITDDVFSRMYKDMIPPTGANLQFAYRTTETRQCAILDFYGNVVGILPYNKVPAFFRIQLDIGSVQASLIVKGVETFTGDGRNAMPTGMEFHIPLPSIPVTSNAYSEYVYSGQRDYEINVNNLKREEQLVNGLLGVGTNTAGGAVSGALFGGAAGAAGGALVGGVGTAVNAGLNYWSSGVYQDRIQEQTDQYYAKQASQVTLPGTGMSWRYNGYGYPAIINLVADDSAMYETKRQLRGYRFENYMTAEQIDECILGKWVIPIGGKPYHDFKTSFVQIENIELTGPVPPEAKQAIKIMLSAGIRLIENNGE